MYQSEELPTTFLDEAGRVSRSTKQKVRITFVVPSPRYFCPRIALGNFPMQSKSSPVRSFTRRNRESVQGENFESSISAFFSGLDAPLFAIRNISIFQTIVEQFAMAFSSLTGTFYCRLGPPISPFKLVPSSLSQWGGHVWFPPFRVSGEINLMRNEDKFGLKISWHSTPASRMCFSIRMGSM